jgi:hypothetical protein
MGVEPEVYYVLQTDDQISLLTVTKTRAEQSAANAVVADQ